MTEKQFRRLLDLVYRQLILNSTRGDDRIRQYDEVDGVLPVFAHGWRRRSCISADPHRFAEGGIHAIAACEDTTLEILAQEADALCGTWMIPSRRSKFS